LKLAGGDMNSCEKALYSIEPENKRREKNGKTYF
jgi:hypothetical protein